MGIIIDGDPAELAAAFDSELSDMLDQALRVNAEYLAEIMKQLTPVRTGETQASIGVGEGYLEYEVGSDSPVFGWLDEGTAGHIVEAVNAQALHWHDIRADTSKTEFFAKWVWVSGIEPLNIMDTAVNIAEPAMDANLELYMDASFDKAAAQAYGVEDFGGD